MQDVTAQLQVAALVAISPVFPKEKEEKRRSTHRLCGCLFAAVSQFLVWGVLGYTPSKPVTFILLWKHSSVFLINLWYCSNIITVVVEHFHCPKKFSVAHLLSVPIPTASPRQSLIDLSLQICLFWKSHIHGILSSFSCFLLLIWRYSSCMLVLCPIYCCYKPLLIPFSPFCLTIQTCLLPPILEHSSLSNILFSHHHFWGHSWAQLLKIWLHVLSPLLSLL